MAGSTITAFTDFVDITGPTTLTEPGTFVNEAVNRTNLIRRFMKGKALNDVMQGGDKIQDFLMLDESSTFEFYDINADFTPRNPQVMTQWEVDWRFAKDECAWTKQEVILNSPQGATRAEGRLQEALGQDPGAHVDVLLEGHRGIALATAEEARDGRGHRDREAPVLHPVPHQRGDQRALREPHRLG
jgi:hypothetical protein